MMGKPDMSTRARDHARVAARQSQMKGIDRNAAGVSLIAEGLGLIYGIEPLQAMLLVQPLVQRAHELLRLQLVDQLMATGGTTQPSAGSEGA